ncbi:MAG: GNAT family N-acetyltransferase [Burkholderiales bacterium]|uniref:GNAT family N-acetyltransferase n=1 Tax=Inhella sp. TaxID=1921806 RepID=UPI001ACC5F47|nr:GNAT family N-acetyltransferase [Burkholderiales bacterium]
MNTPGGSALAWLGNWVPIRQLGRRHRSRITEHLLALTPSDRYLRFGHAIGDTQITRYASTLNFDLDELFGVFNRRLDLIAMAHLAYPRPGNTEWQDTAEFGVSVLDRYRGRGLGSRLFQLSCLHARNRQISYLLIHALSENAAMLHIAERAGAWRESQEAGSVTSRLHLPDDSWLSHAEEAMQTQLGELDFRLKLQAKQVRDFVDSVQTEVKDWLADGGDDAAPPTDPPPTS